MLHAVAAVLPALHSPPHISWVGRQTVWCGARQLRSGNTWLPLRMRLCSSPQMGAREASSAASVDALVDGLSVLVAAHEQSPLQLRELHSSLRAFTAKAASELEPEAPPPLPAKLTVAELRKRLGALGLPTSGLKAELLARLSAATAETTTPTTTQFEPVLQFELDKLARDFQGQGPQTGIFTDGSCSPNPGPGGWGVVAVADGRVLWSRRDTAAETTNNRMEMSAIIHALREVGEEERFVVYSDSQLCVKTLNEWAHGWAANGWKRKSGEIANLDLVREAYTLAQRRPHVRFEWIKAHAGWHWNEHADVLASAWTRR